MGVAEREYSGSVTIGTYFLLNDHLGSLSITVNSDGTLRGELRYSVNGEERLSSGTTSTDYRYTGQLSKMAGIGLYFYQSRFYDPVISHFAQADTIIPDTYNPLDWDRYQYVRSNPINGADPSGNRLCNGENSGGGVCDQVTKNDFGQLLIFQYSWSITNINEWTAHMVEKLLQVGQDLSNALGGDRKVSNLLCLVVT